MRIPDETVTLLAEFVAEEDLRRARVVTGLPWRLIPRILNQGAITFAPFVIYRHGRYRTDTARSLALLAHEMVHIRQAREMGAVRFYASYLWGNIRCGFRHDRHHMEVPGIEKQREVRGVLENRGGGGSRW
ncbi:MAG TPA: DUF4157 domain-containing protein [Tepidiformaceae bacterium]|nr:DUF4157 domain-containing protein [Tepidiformaceae bacterium]